MEIRPDVLIKIFSILNLKKDATDLDLLEAIIKLDNNTSSATQITYVPQPKYPYWDNEPHIID